MKDDQTQLLPPGSEPFHQREHDFIGVFPPKVLPTGSIHMLEHGGNLLIIKSYAKGRKPSAGQDRLWKVAARYGQVVDAPGTVTVVCVAGFGPNHREYQVYDHMGLSDWKITDQAGFRMWLMEWWKGSERR